MIASWKTCFPKTNEVAEAKIVIAEFQKAHADLHARLKELRELI